MIATTIWQAFFCAGIGSGSGAYHRQGGGGLYTHA